MLGWINLSIKLFVCETFGEDKWKAVVEKLGQANADWLSYEQYDDALTFQLVGMACDVLGAPVPTALHLYGRWFISFVEARGYDKLLHLLGSSLQSFLANLNNLHIHLQHAFPAMEAPEFQSRIVDANTLHVTYSSKRTSLWPIVQGIIEVVADKYFSTKVNISLVRELKLEHEIKAFVYILAVEGDGLNKREVELDATALGKTFTIPPDLFYTAFPFHLLLDKKLNVVQMGHVVRRVLNPSIEGKPLFSTFRLVSPRLLVDAEGQVGFDALKTQQDTHIILAASTRFAPSRKDGGFGAEGSHHGSSPAQQAAAATASAAASASASPHGHSHGQQLSSSSSLSTESQARPETYELTIKGQIIPIGTDQLLYLAYPVISDYTEMQRNQLFMSDIPLHDASRDFVLALEHHRAERNMKAKFENMNLELSRLTDSLNEEKAKSDALLYQMIPPAVVAELRRGKKNVSQEHENVTLVFSDIVGFTTIGSNVQPSEVFDMLNALYTRFDEALEDFPELYKVETIGDAYMLVANLSSPCSNHAELMVRFGLRMHAIASTVRNPLTGDSLQIKVGCHSGKVVSGIVGVKMPRYCLFGDAVNTASRMESNSLPGHIHLSSATYECLGDTELKRHMVPRTLDIKGKGTMNTYLLDSTLINQPGGVVDSGESEEEEEGGGGGGKDASGHEARMRGKSWKKFVI